ncbi:MAG: class I SAM-dependent methyltransferase, partial [Saprospiraceae bacterium]
KNNPNSNIEFLQADALEFELEKKYDKILLYFSFQYFDNNTLGKKVIKNLLQHAHPNAIILIGDIPDYSKIKLYYTNFRNLLKYYLRFYLGTSNMGKFWKKEELDSICKSLGIKGTYVQQESWQPYAKYRFDYLIRNS